jgi:hypothetical protein
MAVNLMAGHAAPRVKGSGIDIAPYPFLRNPSVIASLIEEVGSSAEGLECIEVLSR